MTVALHLKSGSLASEPPAPVWLVDLGKVSAARRTRFTELLDTAERQRAARFGFRDRRLQHIAAHGLKRLVLGKIVGERPDALRFGVGEFGKPYLRDHPGIDFSLAHCEGLVGIAVSMRGAVGLDLEHSGRTIDDRVGSRVLSMHGYASALNTDRIRVWTLKEAYVKATGRGISETFDSFTVTLDPPRIETKLPCSAWQAYVTKSHIAALVLINASK